MRLAVVAALAASLLLACAGSPFAVDAGSPDPNPCKDVPIGGACTADSDCVLAFCASACCGGSGQCGGPAIYLRANLAKHRCLTESGKTPAPGCDLDPRLMCTCPACALRESEAKCVNGSCEAVPVPFDAGS